MFVKEQKGGGVKAQTMTKGELDALKEGGHKREYVGDVTSLDIFIPQVGVKYIFSNEHNEFIGEIKSLDPLEVWEWSIVGGCQSSTEISIDSLDEYTITDVGKDEIFRRLA